MEAIGLGFPGAWFGDGWAGGSKSRAVESWVRFAWTEQAKLCEPAGTHESRELNPVGPSDVSQPAEQIAPAPATAKLSGAV
jgi:hypothetical protein